MATERAITLEQELRDLYYDPALWYQSQEQLYQDARCEGLDMSRQKVRDLFEHQSTYTSLNNRKKVLEGDRPMSHPWVNN